MAVAPTTEIPVARTNRRDRAALGVIATYLHELTDHGQPQRRDDDADAVTEMTLQVDDELVDCFARAA
jgi:hypothetical protein